MHIPDADEFIKGYRQFQSREKRDAMYKVATFLLSEWWARPADMADALGVLLLTWNQAFYRYGGFSFEKLERCIADNLLKLEGFRKRDISSLSRSDEKVVKELFLALLDALQIDAGKIQRRRSPVAVAKALHLLAPRFFPLWDDKIARAYDCHYATYPEECYYLFCQITRNIAEKVKSYVDQPDKPLVKLIDEYNYAKYTQHWI